MEKGTGEVAEKKLGIEKRRGVVPCLSTLFKNVFSQFVGCLNIRIFISRFTLLKNNVHNKSSDCQHSENLFSVLFLS